MSATQFTFYTISVKYCFRKVEGSVKEKINKCKEFTGVKCKKLRLPFPFYGYCIFAPKTHIWINISHLLLQDKENGYLYAS